MYCKYCGTQLPDSARFCSECGAKIEPSFGAKHDEEAVNNTYREVEDTPFEDSIGLSDNDGGRQTEDEQTNGGKSVTMGFSAHTGGRGGNSYSDYARRRREMESDELFDSYEEENPLLTQRSRGITILCFIIPLVGLIMWLVWRESKPGLATSAAKGALTGVCFGSPVIGLVLWLVWRESNKELAKPCGIAAIVGAAIAFVLPFFLVVFAIIFAAFYEGFEDIYYYAYSALSTIL